LLAEVWLWLPQVIFDWLQPAQTGSGYLRLAEACLWLAEVWLWLFLAGCSLLRLALATFGWLRPASGWLWLPLAG